LHDLLGVYGEVVPRFAKRYLADGEVSEAVVAYVQEVRDGRFPGPEHSFVG
jgi:3-methyl-2-oxobutanoate hydroxymethyltransferase